MTKYKAGQLYQSVTFGIVTKVPDGQGGFKEVPETVATRAHFRYLRGGEVVLAARLSGRQPIVATVRLNSETRRISVDSTMRDVRTGVHYNIRSVVPTDDRQFLEITAESGVTI